MLQGRRIRSERRWRQRGARDPRPPSGFLISIGFRYPQKHPSREYLIFCVFEPYFAKEREYGDQERDFRRAAEG